MYGTGVELIWASGLLEQLTALHGLETARPVDLRAAAKYSIAVSTNGNDRTAAEHLSPWSIEYKQSYISIPRQA